MDTKKNVENKNFVKNSLKIIAESNLENIDENILSAYHKDAIIKAFHPINELKNLSELSEKIWKPILRSFPDLERRDSIVIGGEYKDQYYVSTVSILTGTFLNSWLGIQPTKKTIHLRLCEVHQLKDKKIISSHMLIDTIDFIRQAGFWPINKSLGVEQLWPSPITGDGSTFENYDDDLSKSSLKQSLEMQNTLNIKPETEEKSKNDKEYLKQELLNHPQKDYWHPKMMWYGPCGIGTARGLEGFIDHHQLPFRVTFTERDYWTIGHVAEIGDGNYSMTAGWHSIECIHGSNEWLGYKATGKKIKMRVMDFYLHNEGLVRENWVPIDIAHILYQMDIDIFSLIAEK